MSSTEPSDDQSISDTELLWRRVLPGQEYYDEQLERFRPQSGAVFDAGSELSVDLASLTTKEICLANAPSKMYLAEFSVETVRRAGCRIIRDPLESNPAHALVCGDHRNGGPTQGQARAIAKKAKFVVFEIPEETF